MLSTVPCAQEWRPIAPTGAHQLPVTTRSGSGHGREGWRLRTSGLRRAQIPGGRDTGSLARGDDSGGRILGSSGGSRCRLTLGSSSSIRCNRLVHVFLGGIVLSAAVRLTVALRREPCSEIASAPAQLAHSPQDTQSGPSRPIASQQQKARPATCGTHRRRLPTRPVTRKPRRRSNTEPLYTAVLAGLSSGPLSHRLFQPPEDSRFRLQTSRAPPGSCPDGPFGSPRTPAGARPWYS